MHEWRDERAVRRAGDAVEGVPKGRQRVDYQHCAVPDVKGALL